MIAAISSSSVIAESRACIDLGFDISLELQSERVSLSSTGLEAKQRQVHEHGHAVATLVWQALLVLLMVSIVQRASAQSLDVDWKYFGGAVVDGKTVLTFYDEKSLVRPPDGHIEVWTKGLAESEMIRVANAKKVDKAVVDRAAKKVAAGYAIPYAAVTQLTLNQYVDLVMDEDIADYAQIQPVARMLFELDCPGRLFHLLSTELVTGGKRGFSNTPSEWEHVPPETNVSALMKILCPQR